MMSSQLEGDWLHVTPPPPPSVPSPVIVYEEIPRAHTPRGAKSQSQVYTLCVVTMSFFSCQV